MVVRRFPPSEETLSQIEPPVKSVETNPDWFLYRLRGQGRQKRFLKPAVPGRPNMHMLAL
jgi:hypothetical protein